MPDIITKCEIQHTKYSLSCPFKQEIGTHSWFTTVVDGTELGPVYPIQLKPLKYLYHENEGAMGATMAVMKDFGINIPITYKKSRIRETLNLSTDADHRTDNFFWGGNGRKKRKKKKKNM